MSKTFDISFRSPLDERIFLNALNGGLSAEELSAIVEDDPLFGAARGRGLSVATAGKILKYKKRLPAKYYRKPADLTRVSNVGQDTIHDLVTSFSRLSIDRKVLLFINSEADVRKVYEAFEDEYCRVYNKISAYPQGGVDVLNLILRATVDYPKPELPTYPKGPARPDKAALKGQRDAYWVEHGAFRPTPIYEAKALKHGNIIEGEAVIEAEDTTIVLPPPMKLTVDKYHNFILEMK